MAVFIGSEIYRLEVFKAPHPLAMPRAMLVRDLVAACGLLEARHYYEAGAASPAELSRLANEMFNALPDELQQPAAAAARTLLPFAARIDW